MICNLIVFSYKKNLSFWENFGMLFSSSCWFLCSDLDCQASITKRLPRRGDFNSRQTKIQTNLNKKQKPVLQPNSYRKLKKEGKSKFEKKSATKKFYKKNLKIFLGKKMEQETPYLVSV